MLTAEDARFLTNAVHELGISNKKVSLKEHIYPWFRDFIDGKIHDNASNGKSRVLLYGSYLLRENENLNKLSINEWTDILNKLVSYFTFLGFKTARDITIYPTKEETIQRLSIVLEW
jgi:hypothetical protein